MAFQTGVHISFVRSVNLDEWKQEHVEVRHQLHTTPPTRLYWSAVSYMHVNTPSHPNPYPSRIHSHAGHTHKQQMERWGNARARAYYEAEVPPGYARCVFSLA